MYAARKPTVTYALWKCMNLKMSESPAKSKKMRVL